MVVYVPVIPLEQSNKLKVQGPPTHIWYWLAKQVGDGVGVGVGHWKGSKNSHPKESINLTISWLTLSNGGGAKNWYGNVTPVVTKKQNVLLISQT